MCKIAEWVVLGLLAMCGVSDWKKKEIPLFFLITLSVSVIVFAVCCGEENLWSKIGGMTVGILLFIISFCTKEAIGYGDSWIVLLIGIHLGGMKVLQVLFVASFLAGLCSIFLLWKHKWKRKATLPFVPFLTLAYLGVMFS